MLVLFRWEICSSLNDMVKCCFSHRRCEKFANKSSQRLLSSFWCLSRLRSSFCCLYRLRSSFWCLYRLRSSIDFSVHAWGVGITAYIAKNCCMGWVAFHVSHVYHLIFLVTGNVLVISTFLLFFNMFICIPVQAKRPHTLPSQTPLSSIFLLSLSFCYLPYV